MSEYKDIKVIASEVREELKKTFPKCKFSVSIDRFSGGQELRLALMEAPFEAFGDSEKNSTYAQLNHFRLEGEYPSGSRYLNNGHELTKEAFETMRLASEIANRDNWDRSDIQSDFFDVNYYFHVCIGKWDKPYKITGREN